ncbi:helix-turn-helix transcriptional regulator [Microbacterium stercoris]|uniref:DNA-binding protein n=1 Tax=Microbacterium stercoris TaxID=2820289 RepID=A0A939QK13_9MICO|nr:hypothetical protein [Microbacterium stercoris]MBO3663117.1 hypothetical protein [Microbacterium stercoris]
MAEHTSRSRGSFHHEWLSPAQVRERYGFSLRHLQYLRDVGRGPMYRKPTAKTVLYAADEVDAWIDAAVVTTRDQP